jgi:energy-coupling factor transporter ATP-binding protein EcfA2
LRDNVGIIFQNPDNQFIGLTAEDDIAFGLENRLIKTEDMNDIIEEFGNKVGLTAFMDYEPQNLSGGQKQRVAIARAIINKPRILLADEPTGALDQASGRQVMELFSQLNQEGMTIIMITHDASVAKNARKVMYIVDGVLSEESPGEGI